MNQDEKTKQIQDFSELYNSTQLFVIAENRGLDAQSVAKLRRKVHESGGTIKVFRNTLAVKALGKEVDTRLVENLNGPNTFLFGGANFIEDLKNIVDFSKESKGMIEVKAGTLDGKFIDTEKLKVLSTLPGKDQMRAILLGTMIAPVRGLVTALAGNVRNLLNVLNAIKEEKE